MKKKTKIFIGILAGTLVIHSILYAKVKQTFEKMNKIHKEDNDIHGSLRLDNSDPYEPLAIFLELKDEDVEAILHSDVVKLRVNREDLVKRIRNNDIDGQDNYIN